MNIKDLIEVSQRKDWNWVDSVPGLPVHSFEIYLDAENPDDVFLEVSFEDYYGYTKTLYFTVDHISTMTWCSSSNTLTVLDDEDKSFKFEAKPVQVVPSGDTECEIHGSLLDFMAKACSYAQEHIHEWDISYESREEYLQCVSYQMACFLAQNTKDGSGGVEWEVFIEELTALPMKNEEQWRVIINKEANALGGWTQRK